MLFFMTYYFVRFFFGGTYWIISNCDLHYHLIKYNQKIKQNKNDKENTIHYNTLLLEDK